MFVSKIYIDKKVVDLPVVNKICSRLDVQYEIINDKSKVYEFILKADDPVLKGKQTLFLTSNNGAFVKKCPGTKYYTCCDYKILHIGTFCNMDCSYCILQSYFHPPVMQYFANYNDLYSELNLFFSESKINRIGTGEFTDSLIWEPWTDISQKLIPLFAKQSSSVLELKTKTVNIKKLKDLDHNRKTIIAWSLNTQTIISHEERNTASLQARLNAAYKCELWGYPLAFHFDPMIFYKGCEKEYEKVVDSLFAHVSAENIVWISLGAFRFIPSLKSIIQKRFVNSRIIYDEFVQGVDGKMRYFKPLRIKLYKKIVSYIRKNAPNVLIYFCMEDDKVWQKVLGFTPDEKGGLPHMLDQSAARHCNLRC